MIGRCSRMFPAVESWWKGVQFSSRVLFREQKMCYDVPMEGKHNILLSCDVLLVLWKVGLPAPKVPAPQAQSRRQADLTLRWWASWALATTPWSVWPWLALLQLLRARSNWILRHFCLWKVQPPDYHSNWSRKHVIFVETSDDVLPQWEDFQRGLWGIYFRL